MNSGAWLATHHSMSAEVDPMKSAMARTDWGHAGWATTLARGCCAFASARRRAGKVACTMQAPCQIFMFWRPVCERLTREEYKQVINPLASTPAMDHWAQELASGATNDLGKARKIFDALARH